MDPEPAVVAKPSSDQDSSRSPNHEAVKALDEEDHLSLNGPSLALLGLVIAIASFGIPLAAVLTERPLKRESTIPTALDRDGSKHSLPISIGRIGKSSS